MPSNGIRRSQEALNVAEQYLRRERPLNALVVVFVVSILLGTYLVSSILSAVIVAAVLLIAVRFPILQSKGISRLRTDDDFETVVDEFTGPTPPILALQWGVADEVTTDGSVAIYSLSYLFGLRSVEVTVHSQTDTAPNGDHLIESEVSVNDQPWATYTSTISTTNEHTVIETEYTSNRRFGLRRIPQQLVANRYADDALTAQGYTVVERDSHFGF